MYFLPVRPFVLCQFYITTIPTIYYYIGDDEIPLISDVFVICDQSFKTFVSLSLLKGAVDVPFEVYEIWPG